MSEKLCTPMLRRVMPASRNPRIFSSDPVPGLSSSEISASGANPAALEMALSTSLMDSGLKSDGVPPPKYTVLTSPRTGAKSSMSLLSALMYSFSIGSFLPAAKELKSQ